MTYYFTQIKEYTVKTQFTFVGKRISSLTTSIQDYLIIIDEQDMYYIDYKSDEVLKIPDLYIKGAQFLDERYLYALIQKKDKMDQCGLHIFDL